MYQYKVERVTRLKGTNQVTAVLDLGFSIKLKVTFKLGRIESPELDFNSVSFGDVDPETQIRNFIFQWFKTSPKPFYVQMNKNDEGVYVGEVLDRDGRNLADDLATSNDSPINSDLTFNPDTTQEIPYGLPPATQGPGLS
jgi:hypothetical protein